MLDKRRQPKYPPRITVELDDVKFRDLAQRAVRKMGYMTLSEYIREKLAEAIQQAAALPLAKGQ